MENDAPHHGLTPGACTAIPGRGPMGGPRAVATGGGAIKPAIPIGDAEGHAGMLNGRTL
jgi:hypothetical protein